MRGLSRVTACVAAAIGVVSFSLPAAAAGALVGAGEVQGTVSNLNFPLVCAPLCPQNFTFSGSGVAAFGETDADTSCPECNINASEGAITVTAVGSSIAENVAGGAGNVSNVTVSSGGICVGWCKFPGPTVCHGVCTSGDSATLSGLYVRGGPIVVVVLTGSITLNTSTYSPAVVVAEGLFIPNQTPPATVTSATFVAAFQAAGVKAS